MALTIDQLNIQIEADSKQATTAIDNLAASLNRLKSSLGSLSSPNKKLNTSLNGTVTSASKAATNINKYDNSTKSASKSTKSFTDRLAQNISKWSTLTGAFKRYANMFAGWFTESNNYIETLNLFNVTMGEGAEAASKYAEKVQELMGIDIAEWMNYQGTFKQLTSGFGVAEEAANTMSQNLTQLSYDLASFFNTDVETAFDKLSSAMSGQVKGLREFGIDTTVASLQEYALSKGIDASVRSMTQAEKSLLRYNFIMEKSTLIQGDMARTIITPSNAMRILNAQLTQMKRALGNVVSVLVAKFIPYVQAMVRLIGDAANALAKFFGFTLPEIDYSGLDTGGFAEDMEDAEDAVGGTADTLKEIKKQLMGFDELNIINNPKSDAGSGGDVGVSGGALSGMEPLEYDFLSDFEDAGDEIYDKLKKMLSPLKKIAGYLWDYKELITAGLGVVALVKVWGKLKSLWTWFKGLKFVDLFLDGFYLIKTMGGNIFQSVVAGITNVRNNLSFMQKAAIVAAAGFLEFTTVKSIIKDIAVEGQASADQIITMGVVAGGAATAMYVALGPAGLAVAALVGIAGVIAGVGEAQDIMVEKFVEQTVFDNYGVKISDMTEILKTLFDTISTRVNTINELGDKIKANDEKISQSFSGLDTYMDKIKNTGTVTKEEAEKMQGYVKDIVTALKNNIELDAQLVWDAFKLQSEKAAKDLGLDVGKMTTILEGFKNTFSDKTEELDNIAQGYLTRLANGEILEADELTELENTLGYLNELSSKNYATQEAVKRKFGELTEIDFENVTTAQEAIADMTQLGIDMNAELETAYETALTSIDTMVGQAKTLFEHGDLSKEAYESFASVMKDYRAGITAGFEQEKDNVKDQLQTAFDFIEGEIAQNALNLYDKALGEFDSGDFWIQMWYGFDANRYAAAHTDKFNETIATPIYDALDNAYEQLNTQSGGMGRDTMEGFFDSARTVINESGTYTGEEMATKAKEALEGYRNSITDNQGKVAEAFKTMTLSGLDAVADAQDSHSPSKEYYKLGKNAIDGYNNAVKDNFKDIENTWKDSFDKLIKSLSSVFDAKTWKSYASNITTALASIKIPKFSNIGLAVDFSTWISSEKKKVVEALGLSGWPSLNWYTYAQGGFPSMGEMFIARERGPELVGQIGSKTTVANNDQIISGIEAGVYRAMMAAGGSGGTQTIRIINEIDGDVVGEKVIQYHNGKVMQTGASPLLV